MHALKLAFLCIFVLNSCSEGPTFERDNLVDPDNPDYAPSGVTNIKIERIPGKDILKLSWDDVSAMEDYFVIERSTGGSKYNGTEEYTRIKVLPANTVTFNDSLDQFGYQQYQIWGEKDGKAGTINRSGRFFTSYWKNLERRRNVEENERAIRLKDGRVLVFSTTYPAQVFDPENESWTLMDELKFNSKYDFYLHHDPDSNIVAFVMNKDGLELRGINQSLTNWWVIKKIDIPSFSYVEGKLKTIEMRDGKILISSNSSFDKSFIIIYDLESNEYQYHSVINEINNPYFIFQISDSEIILGKKGVSFSFNLVTKSWQQKAGIRYLDGPRQAFEITDDKTLLVSRYTSFIYEKSADKWNEIKWNHSWSGFGGLIRLNDGNILGVEEISGPHGDGNTLIFDVEKEEWNILEENNIIRGPNALTRLENGDIFVIDTDPATFVALFRPVPNSF